MSRLNKIALEPLEQKGDRSFDEIMNLHLRMSMVDASYVPYLKAAGVDARNVHFGKRSRRLTTKMSDTQGHSETVY